MKVLASDGKVIDREDLGLVPLDDIKKILLDNDEIEKRKSEN